MSLTEYAHLISPELLQAMEGKGYAELTAVQKVVLEPRLVGRDLRISSQTGSGKTVAIGLSLRHLALSDAAAQRGVARPRALVVAPTRELAQQVERELSWLFTGQGVRVASATGGASYRTEQRAYSRGPGIVVGTPGRLLDHLRRGALDPSQVAAVVLDEADRMLDLGFREDLEAIFELVPEERVTHLVSATFPRGLCSLADRVQRDAETVEGTVLGAANADIDHVIHLVASDERYAAIVNLLLAHPEDQTLIFVRTRADAGELSAQLMREGFAASGMSGEMEQAARNRALSAFRHGTLRVLVCTDVAARGIDVQSVARVIHAELPRDPDAYTHRSGRTGRAGRKGVSELLVPPSAVVIATRLLRNMGVPHRFEPIPTPEQIIAAQDDRLFEQLTAADVAPAVETESEAGEASQPEVAAPASERYAALAQRLCEFGQLERALTRLLAKHQQQAQPRKVRAFSERVDRDRGPQRARNGGARDAAGPRDFVTFRVSWGRQRGADARRLLALACRRGGIRGTDVGAIRLDQHSATVGVDRSVADAFERAVSKPDPREPHVRFQRDEREQAEAPRAKRPFPPKGKPKKDRPAPRK